MDNEWFEFEPVDVTIEELPVEGLILDIGGGGEGVIGRLMGADVIAMDIRKDELDEAPDGPQKLVMDARLLGFNDASFSTVTALFSFMYIYKLEDQEQIFRELGRLVKPGGRLYLWDVALDAEKPTDQPYFIAFLRFHVKDEHWGTGYGMRFPEETRDESYYTALAEKAGFRLVHGERIQHIFHLEFEKDVN